MALTQMQIIQSLGEAMSWFERELNWGVPPTELRHLCGRIGELYAALITNGQMATEVNQRGYDVVSESGERISVKTTAMMGLTGHVTFNSRSLEFVDRVIVLRMNTEEMQVETLLNALIADVRPLLTGPTEGNQVLALSRLIERRRVRSDIALVNEIVIDHYTIRELETGTIEVERDGVSISPVKPVLRELAARLNVSLINGKGNELNTRQLGTQVIRAVAALIGGKMVPDYSAGLGDEEA
ncbi:DUF6998 domain-containing protein [Candidatus Nitrotoga sp. AM1P]|uniref:DUF6998 domain-containing protein n=1 Tax=Candidatus Nitrotoga sp. AM1P TaxID=2559597 RepID=UPI0010B76E4A|nr:hypothetical protein [Candidatus Nitrotoga sp. AM1P]BBJ22802.1 hypothetical protein W01_07290 [Candidatus Nitrotoga sp. AM1P]